MELYFRGTKKRAQAPPASPCPLASPSNKRNGFQDEEVSDARADPQDYWKHSYKLLLFEKVGSGKDAQEARERKSCSCPVWRRAANERGGSQRNDEADVQ